MRLRRTFGSVLRDIRKEKGFSQDLLAHEAGIDRAYVGRIERGESHPTIPTLFALAKALKVRPSEIIARMER